MKIDVDWEKCVYVISNNKCGIVKIGISSAPLSRMKNIETACGFKLELKYITYPMWNSKDIERKCHTYFRKYNTYGEWFEVDSYDVIMYLKSIESEYRYSIETKKYLNGHSIDDFVLDLENKYINLYKNTGKRSHRDTYKLIREDKVYRKIKWVESILEIKGELGVPKRDMKIINFLMNKIRHTLTLRNLKSLIIRKLQGNDRYNIITGFIKKQ